MDRRAAGAAVAEPGGDDGGTAVYRGQPAASAKGAEIRQIGCYAISGRHLIMYTPVCNRAPHTKDLHRFYEA